MARMKPLSHKSRFKYKNQPVEVEGIRFDSKKEAARYLELRELEKKGEIEGLELQPKFPMVLENGPVRIKNKNGHGRTVHYKADFSYYNMKFDRLVVEDVKGFDTPISRLKRAIIERIYDIEIDII